MSIPNLPINFKDDILADTNQKRKYNLIQNDDGTVSFEDATEYQQTGSDFGAGQINATNDAINKAYSERMLNLEEVELVTEPGYFVDALAVKEVFTELNGNLSFLKHKTVKNGPYEFDCYTYMLNGKKVATIHGSWTGKSSPSSIVGGFSVYAISNLQLSPDDAELDIQKHVSVDFGRFQSWNRRGRNAIHRKL